MTAASRDHDAARMSNPFDGAGEPYRGPGFRGPIIVLVVSLVVIAVLWIAYGEALDLIPSGARPDG